MVREALAKLGIAILVACMLHACANADEPLLKGAWRGVEGWINDEKIPEQAIRRIQLRFHGEQLELLSEGKVVGNVAFKVDLTTEPKSIDLTYSSPDSLKGKTRRGIYRLDGDKLVVCFNIDANRESRPTGFEPFADSGWYVHVYEKQADGDEANTIADTWWFRGEGAEGIGSSSQRTGAGPETGEFFAYSGTVANQGSYERAWNFYASMCGSDEKYSEQRRIVGKPTVTGGYYTIFQRTDGGRAVTTFARHEPESTVMVTLHEVEASAEGTVLQITVVVACHQTR